MNLVKRSLNLCIGVMLALLFVQGAQSLYQVARLSEAADDVATSSKLSGDVRNLWADFIEAEKAFQQVVDFIDIETADGHRKDFEQRSAALRGQIAGLRGGTAGETLVRVDAMSASVEAWLSLAAKHVGADGVTSLPSHHLLEAAHAGVQAGMSAVVDHSAGQAAATVEAGRILARRASVWTVCELLVAVALGAFLGWRALRSLHLQLGADASEVARVANAVADGDLTVRIESSGLPEASVMAAMARMQQSLQDTVLHVVAISHKLASGSTEIATGNGDLSRRTEQQALSLETTAATMGRLGSTVSHNAESSAQASRLADQASAVATRGGVVVGQAVKTMRGINDSSKKIGDIIGVIDGIAFQTNILALNAAVEAARAGEQGRGFAVVASEVRSLAQRSAAAAREIKALITASVEGVETGSALVDQAGHTMQEVVQAIQRVTEVMTEIRTASVEQSAGVARVGESIAQLDQATQQNAALAEQGAAAAGQLQMQGQQLAETMMFFKVA